MADSARSPRSPAKTKVVRSQRIASSQSTADKGHGYNATEDDDIVPDDFPQPPPASSQRSHASAAQNHHQPPVQRSHTPGHLATKSHSGRRKPSELSIRQRSQSASASQPPVTSSSGGGGRDDRSGSKTPAPPLPPATLSSKPSLHISTNGSAVGGSRNTNNEDAQASESGGGNSDAPKGDEAARRPGAMRSTSAIASKPAHGTGAAASATNSATSANAPPSVVPTRQISGGTTAPSSRRGTGTGTYNPLGYQPHRQPGYVAFPPIVDPRGSPDVPPAPSSGMYWSRAPVSGDPHTALRAHTTTLVGNNVYVFGGCDSRSCFNELYVLDADSFHWSRPYVAGDVPVPLRAMTCTAVGKKLVIFGGGDGPAYYNDVYVLDTVNMRWSRPRMVGERAPSKRRAHTACLYKNGIYVFGGGDGVRALNDIWRLDVSDIHKMSWKLISGPSSPEDSAASSNKPAGGGSAAEGANKDATTAMTKDGRPKARGYHTANMVGSKLIIFGGSDGGECFNDVWVYDVDAHVWKAVHIPVTYRRLSHTSTIVGSYLFVIGGHDGNEYSNDLLLLNLVTMTWDRRKVYGLPPSGRGYHGTVLHDSRLYVIGGFDGSEVFGDVWLLELAVHAYYSQISHFTIEV